MAVLWILQDSVKGVPRGVPRVCQGCFKGVLKVFQRCCKGVSKECLGGFEGVSRMFKDFSSVS